ncbi:glycosyltransferase [Candidatus Arthromitus sp. SFB-mouse-Japan]|uniref:glycosyltransferase family 4 protein n=1 Tax=unclassified Candidatus Neoarthromitus TaxID=2638829 RepID=UPI00021B7E33|nr:MULTISPECIES: glycosyltransferase family 1 protein [unclassified Candidatus Arthromitus]EIA22554.1 Glycosyltransferase [Candidatus Arthromitus sp. SFB-1]EIA23157.1 Glycosyltransferase [Candidatus Arthromitus sp. SFB-3]EIA27327.1 Glycosyltransferase [Candidatus Arthromitus sp. SFB-co]EIA30251.1 Glycosyltransferase [Candidatus Arthromitus sp. SFB-4]EIA30921.1 Glycosyltransferase [Candidatus Arthromitus sp. SFB-mouse-SU]
MNFSIDIRGSHLYHGTGIGTYTKNLITHLLKIDKENFYNLMYCGNNSTQFKQLNSQIHFISRKHSSYFEKTYIPNLLYKNNLSLFHMPQNGIGYKDLILSKNFKSIVTIHDLIPYVLPQTVGKSYLKNFLKQMPYIIDEASAIITVSEYSKQEIIRFFSVDPNKIFVTPLATNKNFRPLDISYCKNFLKNKFGIDYDFILYIGGFSKRKNIYNLISAFKKAYKNFNKPLKLVLLGKIREEFRNLTKIIRKENLENDIIFTGFVDENDLPIFYNASQFFVYISLYEGFGLPLLEAMSCRKAILSSNVTSIPEVVCNTSYQVDPHDTLKISESLCKLSNDDNLKIKLGEKAYARSKIFSWEKCSYSTLKIYKSLYKI